MRNLAVQLLARRKVAFLQQVVNHPLQAHRAAIIGRVEARDAVALQLRDFGRQNHAATAAKDFDVARAALLQQVKHVFEVLVVPALVAGNGNGLSIFLNGAVHDFLHRTVVPQVNNLGAAALNNAAHDIDSRVVPIKQRGGRDNTNVVFRLVGGLGGMHGVGE
jgi:hypothetical protein